MSNLPPTSPDMMHLMAEALRQQMPSLKTQAQFTAFMLSFDSFRLLMDSVFSANQEREAQARDAFEKSIQAARDITDLSKKFEEVPQEHRTKASEAFTSPPTQFGEYDVQKKLLAELGAISTFDDLNTWYQTTKPEHDKVVTPALRNVLFDAIRAKRNALQPPKEA